MSQKNYISKVVSDAHAALDGLEDNMTVMFGGFGLCGIPENSIAAIRDKGTTGRRPRQARQETETPANPPPSDFCSGAGAAAL